MSGALGFLMLTLAAASDPTGSMKGEGTAAGGAQDSLAVVAVDNCSRESATLLRAALGARSNAKVQSEEETLALLGGPVRGSLQDAQRLLAGARIDFDKEFSSGGRAEKAARQAMEILLSLPPSEQGRWKAICDVASFMAFMYEIDRKPDASRVLEPIMRVEPDFQVDQELYSPKVWREADKARKRVKSLATSTLRVTVKPAGLPVFVDGRPMGKAPIALKVPPGEYRVEALFSQERTLARKVRVKGDTAVELDQAFDGAIRMGAGPCVSTSGTRQERLTSLTKLAAFLGARHVAGIWEEELAKDEAYLTVAALDSSVAQEVREAKVKMSGGKVPAGAMDKLAEFVSTGSATPPLEPVRGRLEARPSSSAPFTEATSVVPRPGWRTASYISGGIALAALGLGTYGFIAASSKQRDLDKLEVKDTLLEEDRARMSKLASEVKSRKTLGVASIGVGVAAIGAAIGCFLYSNSRPMGAKTTIGLTPNVVYLSSDF